MRTILSILLLVAPAIAAPVPKELKKQERLVGLWKLESLTLSGKVAEVADDDTDWMIGEGLTLARSSSHRAPLVKVQLKIDVATKELEWPSGGGSPFLGRYEINADRLTICLGMQNVPRPSTLEPNDKNYVWILRRAVK